MAKKRKENKFTFKEWVLMAHESLNELIKASKYYSISGAMGYVFTNKSMLMIMDKNFKLFFTYGWVGVSILIALLYFNFKNKQAEREIRKQGMELAMLKLKKGMKL